MGALLRWQLPELVDKVGTYTTSIRCGVIRRLYPTSQLPVIATSSRFAFSFTGQPSCQSDYHGVELMYQRVILCEAVSDMGCTAASRPEVRHNQVNIFTLGHMSRSPIFNVNRLVYHRRVTLSYCCHIHYTSYPLYIEFFASRRADITSMRSVLPVNFWISGSCNSTVSLQESNT